MLCGFAIGILGHLSSSLAGRRRGDPDLPRRLPLPAGAQPDRRTTAAAGREVALRRLTGLTIGRPVSPTPGGLTALSRLRILLLFAALAVLATVFAACGSSDSGSSDESPEGSRRVDLRRDRKRRPRPLGQGRRRAATKAATSTSALSGPFQSKGAEPAARTRPDRGSERLGRRQGRRLRRRPRARPEQGLRQLRRRRLRSRPDDLQLRPVGGRRSAAQERRRRRHRGRDQVPGRSGRQVQRRRLRRQPDQRRLGRRRRHRNDQGQRRPQRRQRPRSAHRADRNPGLQLAARSAPARCPSANSKRPRAKSKRR